jgi:hypothetical protein
MTFIYRTVHQRKAHGYADEPPAASESPAAPSV